MNKYLSLALVTLTFACTRSSTNTTTTDTTTPANAGGTVDNTPVAGTKTDTALIDTNDSTMRTGADAGKQANTDTTARDPATTTPTSTRTTTTHTASGTATMPNDTATRTQSKVKTQRHAKMTKSTDDDTESAPDIKGGEGQNK